MISFSGSFLLRYYNKGRGLAWKLSLKKVVLQEAAKEGVSK
jgi:hypothetical protein